MDGEAREYSEIADYNPAVLEDALERDIRDLVAFLITQSERRGGPVAIHAYTDRVHFAEAIRSRLKLFVPPRYDKALDHLVERLEEIATPVFPRDHPTAPIRVVLNIARDPIVDRPTPGSPTAYANGNIDNSILRHGVTQARTLGGIDPEMHDVPPGFAFLAEPAFEDPTDRSTQEHKPPNMYMFNDKELNEMVALRDEHMRRLWPFSGIDHVSKGREKVGEAEGAEAESWLERQNRENKEFFKRREETDRINHARERQASTFEGARHRDEKLFERQREQGKQARETQDRNEKTTEGRNRANEQAVEWQRASDERARSATESNLAALEGAARSNEIFFKQQEGQARRPETSEAEARRYEEIEANNALAEAIVRLEATFGLIAEHEEEIGRAPHSASELMVLGGEIAALRGLLARGIGSDALRARAAGDIQRGMELGPELKRLGAAAALAEEGAKTEGAGGVEAALAVAEAVGTAGEGAGAQETPTAGKVAEVVTEVTGAGEAGTAAEEVPAAEISGVESVAAAGEEAAAAAATESEPEPETQPSEEGPSRLLSEEIEGHIIGGVQEEIARPVEIGAAGAGQPEGAPEPQAESRAPGAGEEGAGAAEVAAAAEPDPASEPQPSEREPSHPIRDEVEEHIIGESQKKTAEPIQTGLSAEEGAAIRVGGGMENEPSETGTAAEGERRTTAGGAQAARARTAEPEPQPSETRPAQPIKEQIGERIVEEVQNKTAEPMKTAKTEGEPEPSVKTAAEEPSAKDEDLSEKADAKDTVRTEPGTEMPPPAADAEEKPVADVLPAEGEGQISALHKIKEHIVEKVLQVLNFSDTNDAGTRQAEQDLDHARAAQKRIDPVADQPSRKREGMRRMQKQTGPNAQPEKRGAENQGEQSSKDKTRTGKSGGGSGGHARRSVIEKAAEAAVRDNHAAEAARMQIAEEVRAMRLSEVRAQPASKSRTRPEKRSPEREASLEKSAKNKVRQKITKPATSRQTAPKTAVLPKDGHDRRSRKPERERAHAGRKPVQSGENRARKQAQRHAPAAQKSTSQKRERPVARQLVIKRPPLPPKKSALPDKRPPLPKTAAMTEQKRRRLEGHIKPHRLGTPPPEPAPE